MVKNITDGKIYVKDGDNYVEATIYNKHKSNVPQPQVQPQPQPQVQPKPIPLPPQQTPLPSPPPPKRMKPISTTHHITIKKMDLAEFCMQKNAFNGACTAIFTDIFYSGYYKQRAYFLNATYICENVSDLHYFTRYLGLKKVVSKKSDVIEDQHTILINPHGNYDSNIYKNVIYTTILGSMPKKVCDAICTNNPKSIYIEPSEAGLMTIPMDFMLMSNDTVYMPNIDLSQDDTFRSVFGHLMKTDFIRVNQYLYDFISHKYISQLRNFFQVNIYNKSYKVKDKLIGPVETTTGNVLFADV